MVNLTKGKFFSITFVKKDGTERTINGKNSLGKPLKVKADSEYVHIYNRNKGSYASVHPQRVKEFKCGDLHVQFPH